MTQSEQRKARKMAAKREANDKLFEEIEDTIAATRLSTYLEDMLTPSCVEELQSLSNTFLNVLEQGFQVNFPSYYSMKTLMDLFD